MLEGEYGNVIYNPTENKFYYIDENGDEQEIDWSDLNTTNVSFTLENDNLIVTDSERNTVELAVEEIANNATFIAELTQNQEFIDEIVAMLEGEYGNVIYNPTENKFYYIDENGDEQEIDWSDLNTTNISFTLENDNLIVTDSAGNTIEFAVEEHANNSTFIAELTQNQEFIDEIVAMLEGEYGNVIYNSTENKFYYIDENGDEQEIDWSDLNTTNVSFTLENDNLIVTDSEGNTVELAVEEIANNATFIAELTQNQEFIDEIVAMLEGEYGNVIYNPTENKFYYIDENGDEQEIDWSDLNTTNVSFTLENDNLIVTDSEGNTVELAVEEIANNATFIAELTQNQEFIDEIVAMLEGEYGNVIYNPTENKFYYIDENGDEQEIDWSDLNTNIVTITLKNDNSIVTDSEGNTVELAVEEIANNSTFIAELTQNQEFIDEIVAMLEGEYGNVIYNPTENKFYYIDENGDEQEIDWSDLNTTNVSFTLENDNLIVTDSEGNTVELAVEEIANNSTFIAELTQNQEFIDAITTVTAGLELVDNGDGSITLINADGEDLGTINKADLADNGDGTYTFDNGNGSPVTIDIPSTVVNQFEEIVQGGPVNIDGDTYNNIEEYFESLIELNETITVLVDNGDGTFTYTNEEGTLVTFDANTTSFTDNGDNTFTFTNDNGDTMTIDTNADAIAFDDSSSNLGGDNVQDAIDALVNASQSGAGVNLVDNGDGTVTLKSADGDDLGTINKADLADNGDGTYTFDNGDGSPVTIEVTGDILENIVNEGDIYNEIINIIEAESDELIDLGNGKYKHIAADGTEVEFDVNTVNEIGRA